MGDRPEAVLIAGPTASGKSGLALDLAAKYGGEIVNADSMQVYGVLNVLTARPPAADLAIVPHHLYGHVPVTETYSVSRWLQDVESVLEDLKKREVTPIFVGGTGLYFRALLEGIAEVPPIPAEIREQVRQRLSDEGSEDLYRELESVDADMAARLKPNDGQRIARALEVKLATGQSLLYFHNRSSKPLLSPDGNYEKILLLPERQMLYDRINRRTELMFNDKVVSEVEELLNYDIPDASGITKAIGVDSISKHLRGELILNKCIDTVKKNSRQYAKRQYTWFNNQLNDSWFRLDRVQ